jgi:hypothetical protein
LLNSAYASAGEVGSLSGESPPPLPSPVGKSCATGLPLAPPPVGDRAPVGEVGEALQLSLALLPGESPCVYSAVGDRLAAPTAVGLGGLRPAPGVAALPAEWCTPWAAMPEDATPPCGDASGRTSSGLLGVKSRAMDANG